MRPLSLFDDPSGPARPLGLIGRTMMMAIAGELVTEAFEYDDGRPVTVYIPADSPHGIVFAGDGQLISQWGGVLEAADVPATMIVGAHRLDDETLRLQEYSPGFEPRRFAAHEQFFVDEVRVGAVALRSRVACRTHRGVRCVGERRACARDGASTSGSLPCGLLRFAGWWLPTASCDAESGSARVPRCRNVGAVLFRKRDAVGDRAARRRRGGRNDRARRVPRRRVLARRVPADGRVGV